MFLLADDFVEEEFSVPGLSGDRRTSIGVFVDKVARRVSHSYSVQVPDPNAFTAVAKAIFGPSGGGIQCKGVFVDLEEGSLTSQTKEVCIQLCRNRTEAVPLNGNETIISRVVELSPRGKPLSEHAALFLPLDDVPSDGFERLLRWTPTQSGEKANWQDVFVSLYQEGCDGDQTAVEFKEKKAKVKTKVFGIFCIISRELQEKLQPLKEHNTSDTIKAFNDNGSATNMLQRFQSTSGGVHDTVNCNPSVHDAVSDASSHHQQHTKRMSIKLNTTETSNTKSERKKMSFFKSKKSHPPEKNLSPPPSPAPPSSSSPPPASCQSEAPPSPPPLSGPSQSSSSPPCSDSGGPPPPPPPPPPPRLPSSGSPASAFYQHHFKDLLQCSIKLPGCSTLDATEASKTLM